MYKKVKTKLIIGTDCCNPCVFYEKEKGCKIGQYETGGKYDCWANDFEMYHFILAELNTNIKVL